MAKRGEGWAGLAGNNLLIVGLASPYVISTAQFGSREKGKRAQKNKTLDLLILTVLATTTSELEPVSPCGGKTEWKTLSSLRLLLAAGSCLPHANLFMVRYKFLRTQVLWD